MPSRALARPILPLSFTILAGLLGLAGVVQAAAPPSSEIQTYLDTIRKAGRSELAWGELMMVSSVQAHAALLSFEKFGEVYVVQYQDRFCGLPGKSQMPETVAAERGMDALRPLADLDGSGFVSTTEGRRFQDLFALGRAIPYIVDHEKTKDAAALARALRRSPDELATIYADYPALTAKSRDLFPPLPALQGLPTARTAPLPSTPAGTDFQALAAEVQATGMSEEARKELLGVAAIRSGAIQLTPRKDPESGQYGLEYRRIEKDAGRTQALAAPQLAELKPFADFDGSGFVTSEEAARFHRLFVFGRQITGVSQQEGLDGPTIARLLGQKPEQLKARLAEYAEVARAHGEVFPAPPAFHF